MLLSFGHFTGFRYASFDHFICLPHGVDFACLTLGADFVRLDLGADFVRLDHGVDLVTDTL